MQKNESGDRITHISSQALGAVAPSPYGDQMDYYANAVRAEAGICWRMVGRPPGFRMGSPMDCPEPVRWMGRTMVGKKRMRVYSCDGHAEEFEDLRLMGRQ
jgi:hypothetical protein